MGPCQSAPTPHSDVDQLLQHRIEERTRLLEQKHVRILLLGPGDGGKSSVFKQMQIIYGPATNDSISVQTLVASKSSCYLNLLEGAKALLLAPEQYPEENFPNLSHLSKQKKVIFSHPDTPTELSPQVVDCISQIWNDEELRKVWDNRSCLQVLDSWSYFAEKCALYPEYFGEKWLPTEEEYLLIKVRTTGVAQATFLIDGTEFTVVDVGGQKGERRKWASLFNGVTAIVFVAATSEYDQVLFEDNKTNRLIDTLAVFKGILNSNIFKHTTVILFLNKSDLFKEKLCEKKIPLNKTGLFPTAPKTFNFDTGMKWIRRRFEKEAKETQYEGKMHIHITCATDTTQTRIVLETCKNLILQEFLEEIRISANVE